MYVQRGHSYIMYMRYMCYHSYLKDNQQDCLARYVTSVGGWFEPCIIGMYIFVPESAQLFVVLYDPELIRRSSLDYITD